MNERARFVGINHVALEVGDVDEALEFYRRFFDFELRGRVGDRMVFIDAGDQFIALSAGRTQTGDDSRHFGLVVDDAGLVRVALERGKVDILPGRGLDFLDPWGNRIQIVQYDEIQFSKTDAALRKLGLEGLGKTAAAEAEMRDGGLLGDSTETAVEIRDVAPGLWLWRQPHPGWEDSDDWPPEVSSFAVESEGVGLLLDPLAPSPAAHEVWRRIEHLQPTVIAVLKPDHLRDVELFVRWYGARALGPFLFWENDLPRTELERLRPDDVLPGGLVALHDGREGMETPLYLPGQRALIFADGMTAPEGELRIWDAPGFETRVLPAFRRMLDLPFERVLVSHGEPVHDRAAFEAALETAPWGA